jgi:uncharacterized protein
VGSYLSVSTQPESSTEPNEVRGLDVILGLQELDLSIDRLTGRLEALETHEEVRMARARVADAEGRVGEVRLAVDEVATQQRRMENDVDSVGQKIEAERKRLYDGSVANPKELQAIEHEVQSLGDRKSRMEDIVLEHMERREALEERLVPAEAEAAEARRRLAEIEASSARELVEVETELGQRTAERADLVSHVDPELLELYEDLRRQKKGVGAAALIDGVCQGCHQKLSPMYLDRMKRSTGVRRCEYCRRILVWR